MRADRRNSIYQKTGGGKITGTLTDPCIARCAANAFRWISWIIFPDVANVLISRKTEQPRQGK